MNEPIKVNLPIRLTVEEAGRFRSELYEYLNKGEKNFIIDFSRCEFIDSTGLGVLVAVYKKCTEKGGQLKLCSINNSQVMKVFRLTRLDKVFSIYSTCTEAING